MRITLFKEILFDKFKFIEEYCKKNDIQISFVEAKRLANISNWYRLEKELERQIANLKLQIGNFINSDSINQVISWLGVIIQESKTEEKRPSEEKVQSTEILGELDSIEKYCAENKIKINLHRLKQFFEFSMWNDLNKILKGQIEDLKQQKYERPSDIAYISHIDQIISRLETILGISAANVKKEDRGK